ncbi:hypothetical protein GGF43_004012 [Coemansia sp. RSA 2618]|nr:hypothetical protein GGF43_004012 [Coemansia sp. RSA 2618]
MAVGGDNSEPPSVDAASAYMLQYGRFEAVHQQQLEALGLPKRLWRRLYDKLTAETFDIGERVVFSADGSEKSLGEHALCLKSEKLEKESDVFLVDHVWTTTVAQVQQDLDGVPGLLERMEKLTGIYEPQRNLPAMPDTGLLDATVDINVSAVMSQAGVDEGRARELLRKTGGDIIEAIVAAGEEKAPRSAQGSMQSQIMQQLGAGAQGDRAREWKTRAYDCTQYSLDGSDQLDGVDIRVAVGAAVRARDVTCSVTATHLTVSVAGSVAVDGELHAAVEPGEATWAVEAGILTVSLVKRKAEFWDEVLAGEQRTDPIAHAKHVQRVARDVWRYLQGYDYLARGADQTLAKRTHWYVADAVGLAVAHSDAPNVRCLPLLHIDAGGQMTPLSILWPVSDIAQGDALARDFCPAWLGDAQQRQGYLLAIFQGPTQFALDAHERLVGRWAQAATEAVRVGLASGPAPKQAIRRLFVRGISPDAKAAVVAAGLELADTPDAADVIFDDIPHEGRLSNQHNLNAIFFSTENAVTAFQRIAGAQSWLSPGFLLKSQICELIGAALMRSNSWWLLKSDQAVAGVEPPTVLTSSWITAVRHADVGYVAALECAPSMLVGSRLFLVERLVLLTPGNSVFVWTGAPRIFQIEIKLDGNKPEPYQVLPPASEVSEHAFKLQAAAQLGPEGYARFGTEIVHVITDAMRLLLGGDSGDGTSFGVFRMCFTIGQGPAGVAPVLHEARPASVAEQLAVSSEFIPSLAAVLAGGGSSALWTQLHSE